MQYPDDMDPECVPLCDAINAMPGLETVSSCCGHGTGPLFVGLEARSLEGLYDLLAHVGAYAWRAEAHAITEEPVITVAMDSVFLHGPEAYREANEMAAEIMEDLDVTEAHD